MSFSNSNNTSAPLDHYFRGGFSVNIVLLTYHKGNLKVLLQEKEEEFIQGELGLLGRLMLANENTDKAVEKLLKKTIGFYDFYKKQLAAFSEVGRHPLGRIVNFTYYGLIPCERFEDSSNTKLKWHDLYATPKLCYDHDNILKSVIKRFRKGLLRHPTVFELLPKEFIISDILKIYELAFLKKLDVPNFRKQIRKSELVRHTGKYLEPGKHQGRKPELYTFDKARYKQIKENVKFNF